MQRLLIPTLLAALWLAAAGHLSRGRPASTEPVSRVPLAPAAAVDLPWTITPTFLLAALPAGAQTERHLTLANDTAATLAYTLTAYPSGKGIIDWLAVQPARGALPPGARAPLTARFDAAGQWIGIHSAVLLVDTDCPTEPMSVTLPVLLIVDKARVYLPAVFKNPLSFSP